jgi:superoxide dismutase, Fe-Mn family
MSTSRRDFMRVATGVAAAGALSNMVASGAAAQESGQVTEHTLPELPYAYNALEPHIDAATLELHHGKHHAGYVKGLNAAEAALAKVRASGDYDLIQHWSKSVAFNGAGHVLHSLFWKTMAPPDAGGGGEPSGALRSKIDRDFGSFDAFKKQLSTAAAKVEGSGWALLLHRPEDDRLLILQVENHQKLTVWDALPVLCVDVWEHAYYLKYQNRRADFIDAWWNLINWEQVTANIDVLKSS